MKDAIKIRGAIGLYKTNHQGKFLEYVMKSNTVMTLFRFHTLNRAIANVTASGSTLTNIANVTFSGTAASVSASIAGVSVTSSPAAASTATASFSAVFTSTASWTVTTAYAMSSGATSSAGAYLSATLSTVLNNGDVLGIRWSVTAQ